MRAVVLNPAEHHDLTPQLLTPHGQYMLRPASWWNATTRQERALYGHRSGRYHFPSVEVVEWIGRRIEGAHAIEVCAGTGDLARLLAIPAFDNRMQDRPDIARAYAAALQPTIPYGPNVETADANEIVRAEQPDVVVAAWMTHRYNPARHDLGGNAYGPDHMDLLANCRELIFIGNSQTHATHPLLRLRHALIPLPVFSRAQSGEDFVAVITGGRA